MRMFVVIREEDVTGVSGTGVVAEGIEFSDGTCVIRWRVGNYPCSTTMWNSTEDALKIHGHDGRTRFVYSSVRV